MPTPAGDVEAQRLSARDGEAYYVLRSPTLRYLRLDDEEFDLWRRMDGRRTVGEIAVEHFVETGQFAADRLARLVRELRGGGFLGPPPVDCFAAVQARLKSARLLRRVIRVGRAVFSREVCRIEGADRFLGALYRGVGWLAFTRAARTLGVLLILVGLAAWWRQFILAEHALFQTRGSYVLGLLTLILLDVVGVNLHDLAQGLAMKRYGRRVHRAGLHLSFFFPILYVDTSDVWLAQRGRRIAVAWAGPCALLVLGSSLAIVALPLAGSEIGAFLFKAATIWLVNAFFNLLPVLDLNGYFILVDYLELPALRANSLRFIRHGMMPRLRARQRFTREELIFTGFGLATLLVFILVPLLMMQARDLRYADALASVWERPGIWWKLLAIAMTIKLLGPSAFSITRRLVQGGRRVARFAIHRWRRKRGEVPQEYVQALAELPFLRNAARAELVAIAHHLEPEEAAAGTILVRQGAPGDRFYLLRSGVARVGKLTADGVAVPLAHLGPGDYFGEAALVARVPRTASVVAESDVTLLTLDAGHFRRWVGGRLDVAAAVRRSLAERDTLLLFPILRGLGPADLDRLAARLVVTRHSAGDAIVRQDEPGENFYLIADGRVEVVREHEGRATRLAELGTGDYFGEMALLHKAPRSATVRALTAVETYALGAEDFHGLLGRLPASTAIRRTAAERAGVAERSTVVERGAG